MYAIVKLDDETWNLNITLKKKILSAVTQILFICNLKFRDFVAWACGAMDNASDYGSEDSRFESWQARIIFLFCNKAG